MSKKRFTITIGLSVVLLLIFVLPSLVYAQDPPETESWFVPGLIEFLNYLIAWVGNLVLQLVSSLVYAAGTILDYIVKYTVIDMKTNIDSINGIAIGWKAIRDLANMAFIFVLLYAAIGTILQLERVNAKRLIVNIIIVALFVNFSLFFTKVIIDASNIVAIGFYERIGINETDPNAEKISISAGFRNALGLADFLDPDTGAEKIAAQQGNMIGIFIYIIGNAFMIVVGSFIFFATAILFLIRFGVLTLLMVLSPLAFVAYALPGTSGQAKKWWETLIGQSVFAPAYMILTWLTLTILGTINNIPSTTAASKAVGFLIVAFFMLASLIVAKSFATQGAQGLGKISSWAQKKAGGAVLGTTAWGARQSAGRIGQAIANSKRLQNATKSKNFGARIASRLALRGGDKLQKSSFDVRESRLAKFGSSVTGVDLGKASKNAKGGVKKTDEELAKAWAKWKEEGAELYAGNPKEEIAREEVKIEQTQEKIDKEDKKVASREKEIEDLEKKIKDPNTNASDRAWMKAQVDSYKQGLPELKKVVEEKKKEYQKEIKDREDRLDALKGVDAKEAKRRAEINATSEADIRADVEKTIPPLRARKPTEDRDEYDKYKEKREADIQKLVKDRRNKEVQELAKKTERVSESNQRREAYRRDVVSRWNPENIFRVSSANLAASAQIRDQAKEKNSIDKLVAKLDKLSGGMSDEEKQKLLDDLKKQT